MSLLAEKSQYIEKILFFFFLFCTNIDSDSLCSTEIFKMILSIIQRREMRWNYFLGDLSLK
jgi:hypothetical protein